VRSYSAEVPEVPSPATFVVEDSFKLEGRGLVLAPPLPADRFPSGANLVVEVCYPDGAVETCVGRFLVEHLLLTGGGSAWSGVVVLDEEAPDVRPGNKVTARLAAESD
jgi:hypothetical protein